ncbi:MAG: glycoside hydrolase family 2 [Planctomycetes bacterium]|nr:glycoside hydrolase family 2 [Planctomycetota bacterium]
MRLTIALLGIGLVSSIGVAHAQESPTKPRLATRWSAEVDRRTPLAEYPRPSLVRPDWSNLNGTWRCALPAADEARRLDELDYSRSVLVPFAIEAQLSGVGVHAERVVYRRSFTVPAEWRGRRLLLNFGAVDWRARVFVDGRSVGEHSGGFDAFSFDVTDALEPTGTEHELVVDVFDPTQAGGQPLGKQRTQPNGIWYTPVTGIWQTVWLEPVADTFVERLVPRTTLAREGSDAKLELAADVAGWRPGDALEVEAPKLGKRARAAERAVTLELGDAAPWTPETPVLHDLVVRVVRDGKVLDEVRSYCALREIELAADGPFPRFELNGRPRFLVGALDQGWWPDGLYTAPTDAALAADVEALKALGFDFARKHVKVEPERWYWHCDRLGLLVWQDMPSPRAPGDPDPAAFERELVELVREREFHPSVVHWIVFNEGWGQHDTARYVDLVRRLDSTRPITDASGWTHAGVGDVVDYHHYPAPTTQLVPAPFASVLGEFGGIALRVKDHLWQADSWGYREDRSAEMLVTSYTSMLRRCHEFSKTGGLAAVVYTQLTDVEGEINGLMTYDRVFKADPALFARANRGPHPALRVLVGDGRREELTWHYSLAAPGEGWERPGFDDSRFEKGLAGFGTRDTPGAWVRTEWTSSEIWLRREFQYQPTTAPEDVLLSVHHDEDCEIWINGVLAAELPGYTTSYEEVPLSPAARAALKPGTNLFAAHCKQTGGGQYFDVGLVAWPWPK